MDSGTATAKIKKLSKVLRFIAAIAMISTPVLVAMFWINQGQPFAPWLKIDLLPEGLAHQEYLRPIADLKPIFRLAGFLVSLIPAGITVMVCFYLSQLFAIFEKMEFFSEASVGSIRKIGWTLLIGQMIHPFYVALMTLVLSISNPAGERFIAVELGAAELKMIAIAAGIILISWIMDEGRKLQEENAATI